ncbi:type II and III secretion system protein family protein [Lichenihabitans sp. Uapishka_5]|uniref:type II and III secretion system protein family protein n=1 Tax=Lichenihabitans sp. Uapishka_5 TaxID=3037302 RepID=UPI0029E7D390|nr:type II and III secretion system protein family protein [Lichenihabitans sp. Uapishka_5]MDX7952765.1 type II and III secretion system protein family protein [Lichenihabitans sp. Uapishka_5]
MPAPISRRARQAAPIVLAALALGSTLIGHAARAQPIIDQGRNVASVPAPPFVKVAPTQPVRRFTLAVGKSSIVDLPGDASEVFIGNPAVANAVVRSAHKMFVMGVANGQTTIFALDKAGNQLATLELTVGRDTSELSAIYRTALPDADIRVQTVDDTIILTGTVNSAVDAQRALDIANAFVNYTAVGGGSASSGGSGSSISFGSTTVVSGKLINSLVIRERDQVMLKVQVVEVQRAVLKQLGVTFNGDWSNAGAKLNSLQSPTLNAITGAGTPGGLGQNLGLNAGHLSAMIQAFERNGVAHVLAEPTVAAISGESAKFTAGGSIPISSGSTITKDAGGNITCTFTTSLQNYGVTLNFTPTVLSEGRISLHLATEVTEPDGLHAAQTVCANTTGFRTRTHETTVELPSGGSIVSAGLIQQTSKQAIAGIPGLMNLPILGALFRSRDYQRDESELMIVVTPYITKTLAPDQISRPDDGLADASDPQSWFLGRINRIYSTADNPDLIRNYRGRVGFITD